MPPGQQEEDCFSPCTRPKNGGVLPKLVFQVQRYFPIATELPKELPKGLPKSLKLPKSDLKLLKRCLELPKSSLKAAQSSLKLHKELPRAACRCLAPSCLKLPSHKAV